MRRFLILSVAIAGIMFPSVGSAVNVAFAEDGATPTSTPVPSPTSEADSGSTEKRNERLNERKKNFTTKLTAANKLRLSQRCGNAQIKLKDFKTDNGEKANARTMAYGKMVEKLTALSDKLDGQNIDNKELNAEITQLQTLIDNFKTKLTVYKDAVADAADMKCTDDVDAFKASIEAARSSQKDVIAAMKAVREYITGTIKPTLKTIKDTLQDKDGDAEGTPTPVVSVTPAPVVSPTPTPTPSEAQ